MQINAHSVLLCLLSLGIANPAMLKDVDQCGFDAMKCQHTRQERILIPRKWSDDIHLQFAGVCTMTP